MEDYQGAPDGGLDYTYGDLMETVEPQQIDSLLDTGAAAGSGAPPAAAEAADAAGVTGAPAEEPEGGTAEEEVSCDKGAWQID